MVTGTRTDPRLPLAAESPTVQAAPDPTWHKLYRWGGISAIGYLVLALVVPFLQVLWYTYDFEMDGPAYLQFIAAHKVGWMTFQILLLGASVLAIIAFIALYVALKHVDKSLALIGATLGITMHILFIAYLPVLLGMVFLSNQYMAAPAAQQSIYAVAAEALIAMNNGFNPFYEPVFAVSIGILSWVMLHGVFSKFTAYVGLATPIACIVAMSLWPLIGIGYFWWWLLFMLWFALAGWRLIQLGRVHA